MTSNPVVESWTPKCVTRRAARSVELENHDEHTSSVSPSQRPRSPYSRLLQRRSLETMFIYEQTWRCFGRMWLLWEGLFDWQREGCKGASWRWMYAGDVGRIIIPFKRVVLSQPLKTQRESKLRRESWSGRADQVSQTTSFCLLLSLQLLSHRISRLTWIPASSVTLGLLSRRYFALAPSSNSVVDSTSTAFRSLHRSAARAFRSRPHPHE
jgi:hypothetical protein